MNNYLPVMILKDTFILPNTNQDVKIELDDNFTKSIYKVSTKHHDGSLLIVCSNDILEEEPSISDLPSVGIAVQIKNSIDLPNGNVRLTVCAVNRVIINEYRNLDDKTNVIMASVKAIVEEKYNIVEQTAIRRKLIKTLTQYINEAHTISNSVLSQISQISDLNKLTDIVASFIPLSVDKRIYYMQEVNSIRRANNLIYDISVELEVLILDQQIEDSLRIEMEENQREYILREKINYIKKELGEKDDTPLSLEYNKLLNKLDLNDKTKKKLQSEINRLDTMPDTHPEKTILKNYLDNVLNLPWNNESSECYDIEKIKKVLDKSHYGIEKAKERILEYAVIKKRNNDIESPIICLVGPPGVGKTSFAMNVSDALNREFYKISVGGLSDTTELMGNRRTYLGSNMGKIMQAIKKCEVKNPVILIDEIDKLVKNYQGDPASCLLEILDKEQNRYFIDNYIEEPFDLSKVLFILTANDESLIPKALYDRLEIIQLSSYSNIEKVDIVKKHMLPVIFHEYNVSNKEIKLNDNVIMFVIDNYTKEAGLRDLNRVLRELIRKVIFNNLDKEFSVELTKEDVINFLGKERYSNNNFDTDNVGMINALAYSSVGGVVFPIECCFYEGKGNIITTGMVLDAALESIKVAISYIRNKKDYFRINDYYFINKDLHINFMDSSIRKDGASGGIAITSALLSLLLNKKIPNNVCMSGEISLNGDVYPVGKVKEKVLAAYNLGINNIYLSYLNENDVLEIPISIRKNLNIKLVKNYSEIFEDLFN